jgi:hypothetical protein
MIRCKVRLRDKVSATPVAAMFCRHDNTAWGIERYLSLSNPIPAGTEGVLKQCLKVVVRALTVEFGIEAQQRGRERRELTSQRDRLPDQHTHLGR